MSAVSAIAWVSADITTRREAFQIALAFWNAVVKFGVFFSVTYFATGLKQGLIREKELNRELERNVGRLKAANTELEAFNHSISHDLRTPLVAIEGISSRMAKRSTGGPAEDMRDGLLMIRKSAGKMRRLIDDLLAYSRSERRLLESSTIDMNELARGVFEELKTMVPQRAISLTLDPLPTAHGDPVLLRQVLYNLLSNAVKFTRGREDGLIEMGSYMVTDEMVYWVRDNGVGFPSSEAHKLFRHFQRLHREEEFEGTGLGLAIVQRIIERHGGRVWAEGEVNRGATFYFSIALQRED